MGIVFGFVSMFVAFSKKLSGWEDLIGILNLLLSIAIGLGIGLLAQLAVFLYHKFKKRSC
jgi:hypothetical protein